MTPTGRIVIGILALLALGFGELALSQVTSTRDTPHDWRILDANKVRIGTQNYARFDTAMVACLNAVGCVYVEGGRYRIGGRPVAEPPPPPPPPPAGTAALSWTPSAQPTGVTVASYRINYGAAADQLVQVQPVGNVTTATLTGLAAGTHYFCVKTVDTTGQESACSEIVSKTVT
jgi:hypothetical protein